MSKMEGWMDGWVDKLGKPLYHLLKKTIVNIFGMAAQWARRVLRVAQNS